MAKPSRKEPPLLSPEQAATVQKRILANLLRKVESGKIPTRREQQLIDQYASHVPSVSSDEWVSRERLAQELGCHPNSIPRFTTEHPDAPKKRANGTYNLPAWLAWKAKHPEIEFKKEHALAGGLLKDQKLRIEIETRQFNLNVLKKTYIERALVVASNRRVGAALRNILQKLLNEMPGAVAGKDIPQARDYGGRLYDALMLEIASWEKEWPE